MRIGSALFVLACIAMVLPRLSPGGEDKADTEAAILKEDLRRLQGRWELIFKAQGRTVRSVQAIDGNKSTVTRYDEKGAVLEAHTADFTLSISGRTKIFTYSNYEVTAGPAKGKRRSQRSYVYRLDGDSFFEVRGVLVDQSEPIAVNHWRRMKERVAVRVPKGLQGGLR